MTTNLGDVYYSGMANLLNEPEFLDINLSRSLFGRLDEVAFWEKILNDMFSLEDEIYYMLGEEDFHDPAFDCCAQCFWRI